MDLAKIRQKARQEQENRRLDMSAPLKQELTVYKIPPVNSAARQTPDEGEYFQDNVPATLCTATPETLQMLSPVQRIAPRNPLEVILAGRDSTGCGENLLYASDTQAKLTPDSYRKFLCFKVSNELYGLDIMAIKELIKPRNVTEVPSAPSFVSGIISLRGAIIPVIDMLDRLGLARETVTGRERVIVVRQGESFCGLLVNEIIQVIRLSEEDLETAPPTLDGIDRDFVSGIGRSEGMMIIILNLPNIIDLRLY